MNEPLSSYLNGPPEETTRDGERMTLGSFRLDGASIADHKVILIKYQLNQA